MNFDKLPLSGRLLEAMANTQQNPRYHSEGDVLAHTQLVLQRYYEMRDAFDLSEDEKEILYWTAVLHDTGKTKTTVFEEGRWRSPGHERASLPIARDVLLRESKLSAQGIRKVLSLVRWHGFPLRWVRHKWPLDTLKRLGTQTDLRLLSIFSLFDFKGRIPSDTSLMPDIEDFHRIAVPRAEYEFGKYDHLQQQYAGWTLRHKNAAWSAIRMKNTSLLEKLVSAPQVEAPARRPQKAVLTVGPALSGKTRWLERNFPEALHISLDEHGLTPEQIGTSAYDLSRRLSQFRHYLSVYLNRHATVVLEGRNLEADFRRQLADLLRDMNVEMQYLVFETPLEELLARNRAHEQPLPEDEIRKQYEHFELLHPWEAHYMEYVHP